MLLIRELESENEDIDVSIDKRLNTEEWNEDPMPTLQPVPHRPRHLVFLADPGPLMPEATLPVIPEPGALILAEGLAPFFGHSELPGCHFYEGFLKISLGRWPFSGRRGAGNWRMPERLSSTHWEVLFRHPS